MQQQTLMINTPGRGFTEISALINDVVQDSKVSSGLCHLFLLHTSASLIICENADPDVRVDLETFLSDLVKDGDPRFSHIMEGKDDMSAHIRSILTASTLTLAIQKGVIALGTWQGIYLWEHRYHAHQRKLLLTIQS